MKNATPMIAVWKCNRDSRNSFDFYCHHLFAFAFKARWLLSANFPASVPMGKTECF
jgi:hypothetical protein